MKPQNWQEKTALATTKWVHFLCWSRLNFVLKSLSQASQGNLSSDLQFFSKCSTNFWPPSGPVKAILQRAQIYFSSSFLSVSTKSTYIFTHLWIVFLWLVSLSFLLNFLSHSSHSNQSDSSWSFKCLFKEVACPKIFLQMLHFTLGLVEEWQTFIWYLIETLSCYKLCSTVSGSSYFCE